MEVFGPPTISVGKFGAVMAGSPLLQERSASAYYHAIKGYGLDPCFILAVMRHENDIARNPDSVAIRYGTKNVCNTRTNSGVSQAVTVETDRGPFLRFATWLDGLHDACNRLVHPLWPYAQHNAHTVEEIIPLWAPATDNNNVANYVASVLLNMMAWRDISPMPDLMLREAIIPKTNANRPKLPMVPKWITVHETGNTDPGANAEMHRRFLVNGGGPAGVSFHYCVDDREAVHLIPDDENAWHASDGRDGTGNRKSIAIETCVNAGGNWARTTANLARLIAMLMVRHNIPLANVVQHNHWAFDKKNCPTRLRARDQAEWKGLIAAVHALTQPTPPPARPEGWLNLNDADVFRWEGEGVIVERSVVYYNAEKGKYYRRSWHHERGYSDWEEIA